MLIWFACVNGPFYRGTVSAFLHPTPGGLMLPIGHRCRMWGRSDIFGSSQRRLWLRFLRQVLGGFLFLLASEGCFLSLRSPASLARIPPFHQGRMGERESCERVTGKKRSGGKGRMNLSLWNHTSIPHAWARSPDATCECQAINHAVV